MTANPVTLTWINHTSDKVGLPVVQAQLAQFAKESGIQVKDAYQSNNGASYQPAVRTAFASSSPPDLANDIAGPEVYLFARAGAIRDITDFIHTPAMKPRLAAGATTGAELDGKTWALSQGLNIGNILWYNPAYLKKYGLDGSKVHTWADFLHTLQVIKQAGGTPIALGGKDGWPGGHWLTDLVQRTLGDTATNALYNRTVVPGSPTTPKWTDPPVVKAFQMLVDISQYFQDGAAGEAAASADAIFLSGQAAWYEMGSWFISTILDQKPAFTPGLILFPSIAGYPGTQRQVTIGSEVMMVSKRTPYWDAIQKFLLFWTRPEIVKARSEQTTTLLPYAFDSKNLKINPAVKSIFSQVITWINGAGPGGAILFNDEAVDVNMYTKYIWQGSTGLLSNGITAAALCAQLESATVQFQKAHPKK